MLLKLFLRSLAGIQVDLKLLEKTKIGFTLDKVKIVAFNKLVRLGEAGPCYRQGCGSGLILTGSGSNLL